MALPPELVLAIARHLPPRALPALALTCATWSLIARQVLYRHLAADAHSPALLAVLASRPDIARHVRSFHIALDPALPLLARFYALLADALCNMSDLTSLHLLVDPAASWLLPARIYPSLVHFASSFSLDHHLIRFLHLTPALRQLELDSVSPPGPLPPLPSTCIPRLEQFIGASCAAAAIVPGRPVSSIHLNASVLPDDDIPLLARSSAHVLVLAAVTNAPPVAFLQRLQRHLPHLTCLRVMSTQNLCQPPSTAFYEQVATMLGAFAHLNAFELSGIHWGSQPKPDSGSERVWQSSPLYTNHTDDPLFPPDLFLAY